MISNGLDADQTRHVDDGFIRSLLIWIYTVFKTEYILVQHWYVNPLLHRLFLDHDMLQHFLFLDNIEKFQEKFK